MNECVKNVPAPEIPAPGWGQLLLGKNLIRSLVLAGGVALHAINLYISTTILPSVVKEIGGLDYYAWNTTLFVVASILGAALCSRVLAYASPRVGYAIAALVFAIGALTCATAPTMAMMLAGRLIQGLGGGLLLALPYAMIRKVFSEPMWSHALALLSCMWGVATLLGPAVGGIFAEIGLWRAAFWALIPPALLFILAAFFVLPRDTGNRDIDSPVPVIQLGLLTLAVLAASWSSVGSNLLLAAISLVFAFALIVVLTRVEKQSPTRLLPRGTFASSSPLGALYAMTALLAVAVTSTEIFLPLFLQDLHGSSPLEAGYIAAMMSAGWTVGAIFTSWLGNTQAVLAIRVGPVLTLLATFALAFRPCEEPVLASKNSWPNQLLDVVVIDSHLAVIQMTGQGCPPFHAVIQSFGDGHALVHKLALSGHPRVQHFHHKDGFFLPYFLQHFHAEPPVFSFAESEQKQLNT